jgi:hypothetical protein
MKAHLLLKTVAGIPNCGRFPMFPAYTGRRSGACPAPVEPHRVPMSYPRHKRKRRSKPLSWSPKSAENWVRFLYSGARTEHVEGQEAEVEDDGIYFPTTTDFNKFQWKSTPLLRKEVRPPRGEPTNSPLRGGSIPLGQHYNRGRPHTRLGPGFPDRRSEPPPRAHRHRFVKGEQVTSTPVLGGLHHEYELEQAAA